ncbi:peptidylprolyl isomerase [Ferruginibacter sp.]|uniref:FKBP-type peptidyl-prolyl cis-trans isomerase n=1 Tax=Ferruginibacter sp. TaxID=1940288 RepID=UPI00374D0D7C
MIVSKHTVVSIEYELSNEQEIILDSNKGFAPFDYVQGAGNIVAAVEEALNGCGVNESKKILVLPEVGFGLYDEALLYQLPLKEYLDSGFTNVDDRIQLQDGRTAIIVSKDENYLTADANHPLAGQSLYYEVTIKNIRAATSEEIVSGHPLAAIENCSGKSGCC